MGRTVLKTGRSLEEIGTQCLTYRILLVYLADVFLAYHLVENRFKAIKGCLWMQQGIIGIGRAWYTRQHSRLRQVKLHRGWHPRLVFQAEVDCSSRINPICLFTIIDTIQVHFQDVILAIMPINLWSENNLFEFTNESCLVSHDQILNQLLGNCTAPLDNLPAT